MCGYDWATNAWTDTSTVLETRTRVDMDTLWDGTHLYVLSTPKSGGTMPRPTPPPCCAGTPSSTGLDGRRRDAVTIAERPDLLPGIDKDSTGMLWVTYTTGIPGVDPRTDPTADAARRQGDDHPLAARRRPELGDAVPAADAGNNDDSTVTFDPVKDAGGQPSSDIAAVVSFDGNKMGVLWSNQRTEKVHWATHVDGADDQAWATSVAYNQPKGPTTTSTSSRSPVATPAASSRWPRPRTPLRGRADQPALPQPRQGSGPRGCSPTVADNVTRASVVDRRRAPRPLRVRGRTLLRRRHDLLQEDHVGQPPFGRGQGTPFISSAAHPEANNVTSTKQTVSSATGLLALAGDDQTRTYLYNRIDLGTDTAITSQPDAATTTADASFGFTATVPGGTFLCSLDGAAETACTSPQSYTGLANGNHTFSVRSVEAGGTQDPSPATYSWNVAVPPRLRATRSRRTPGSPCGRTAVSTRAPRRSPWPADEAGSTFRCSLDGKPAVGCGSPVAYRGLADGDHTFSATAVDAAGNADATPEVYSWKITPWFFDGFSSKNFSHGGWLARHSRHGQHRRRQERGVPR